MHRLTAKKPIRKPIGLNGPRLNRSITWHGFTGFTTIHYVFQYLRNLLVCRHKINGEATENNSRVFYTHYCCKMLSIYLGFFLYLVLWFLTGNLDLTAVYNVVCHSHGFIRLQAYSLHPRNGKVNTNPQ